MEVTTQSTTSVTAYIGQFRELFMSGVQGFVQAATLYVKAIDDNPKHADAFRDACKDIVPAGAWSGFEAVGRKWMHPKLLLGSGGRYAGKIRRLPYSVQERIFNGERFEMLTASGDVLRVDVRELEPEQAEQMFDGSALRGLPAQKAWLEARKAKPVEPVELLPYTITGDRVTFRRGTVLTRAEVKRLALEM